jgi:hypothetical protein
VPKKSRVVERHEDHHAAARQSSIRCAARGRHGRHCYARLADDANETAEPGRTAPNGRGPAHWMGRPPSGARAVIQDHSGPRVEARCWWTTWRADRRREAHRHLTAGGDTPALNATIHGAVVRANQLKLEIIGFIKGFNSLFNPRVPYVHLNPLYQEIPERRRDRLKLAAEEIAAQQQQEQEQEQQQAGR